MELGKELTMADRTSQIPADDAAFGGTWPFTSLTHCSDAPVGVPQCVGASGVRRAPYRARSAESTVQGPP